MSDKQNSIGGRVDSTQTGSGTPAWLLVFRRELSDLWIGGKAPNLLLLFSILLGIMSYVLASNSELNLIPPKEMVFLTLEAAIAVGLFIGLIIGADSISGERERATLEALLLTPTSRRQIVIGKFLAAISPWPAALIISIPYLKVLSQGDDSFALGLIAGAILGTLLAPAFTGFGMLMSIWSNSNKGSLFASLTVYLLFLIPTQFPGSAQTGGMGKLLKKANPMESVNHFLEKIIVNNRTVEEMAPYLFMPIVFGVVVLGLLFFFAGPRLHLEGGRASMVRPAMGRVAGMFLLACLIGTLSLSPALAQETEPDEDEASQQDEGASDAQQADSEDEQAAPEDEGAATEDEEAASEDEGTAVMGMDLPLHIAIDLGYKLMKTGDRVEYHTTVKYDGVTGNTPPMIVAMNIVNLEGDGDPVDPEDWSPERAQYLEPLAPGESATQTWTITTILEGDYMVYMTLIPAPDSEESTSQPVASSGIHITVEAFTTLNPAGVFPIAAGMPAVLMLGIFALHWQRRRGIDTGGTA